LKEREPETWGERRGNKTESKKRGTKTRGRRFEKQRRKKAKEKGGRTTGCCQHNHHQSHLQLPSSSPSSITAPATWEMKEEAKTEKDGGNHTATKK